MISVRGLCVRAGAFALGPVSFEIPVGLYGVLMGRTGSGKTTVLETVCGLHPAAGGAVELDGRDVTALTPAERNIGYVPQDLALFRTMTVRDHLAFAPVIRKWSSQAVAGRVAELAELLGIAHLLDRRPRGLSGGESQRVALGRALACRPPILLLDEPLSALDDRTREGMYDLLKSVQKHTGVTVLHVTHSPAEARRLADRLLLLEDGEVREGDLSEGA